MKFLFNVALFMRPADRHAVAYREVSIDRDARFQAIDAFWDALREAGFAVGNTIVPEDDRLFCVDLSKARALANAIERNGAVDALDLEVLLEDTQRAADCIKSMIRELHNLRTAQDRSAK